MSAEEVEAGRTVKEVARELAPSSAIRMAQTSIPPSRRRQSESQNGTRVLAVKGSPTPIGACRSAELIRAPGGSDRMPEKELNETERLNSNC